MGEKYGQPKKDLFQEKIDMPHPPKVTIRHFLAWVFLESNRTPKSHWHCFDGGGKLTSSSVACVPWREAKTEKFALYTWKALHLLGKAFRGAARPHVLTHCPFGCRLLSEKYRHRLCATTEICCGVWLKVRHTLFDVGEY